jgi:hypothetical protein
MLQHHLSTSKNSELHLIVIIIVMSPVYLSLQILKVLRMLIILGYSAIMLNVLIHLVVGRSTYSRLLLIFGRNFVHFNVVKFMKRILFSLRIFPET